MFAVIIISLHCATNWKTAIFGHKISPSLYKQTNKPKWCTHRSLPVAISSSCLYEGWSLHPFSGLFFVFDGNRTTSEEFGQSTFLRFVRCSFEHVLRPSSTACHRSQKPRFSGFILCPPPGGGGPALAAKRSDGTLCFLSGLFVLHIWSSLCDLFCISLTVLSF